MLKWAKTIDWLAINSSALILLVVLQVLAAFPPQPVESPNQQAKAHPRNEPYNPVPWWLGSGTVEAFFTGLIALYAIRQYVESRRSSERQLRAYITVGSIRFQRPGLPNGDDLPWRIEFSVRNSGQTPAYRVGVIVQSDVGVTRKPDDAIFELGDGKVSYPESLLPPGTVHEVRLADGLEFGKSEFLDYQSKNLAAYIWGRVDYVDCFGNPHWTQFQAQSLFGSDTHFGYFGKGNRTDDEL
jgi:hypothetical protein